MDLKKHIVELAFAMDDPREHVRRDALEKLNHCDPDTVANVLGEHS